MCVCVRVFDVYKTCMCAQQKQQPCVTCGHMCVSHTTVMCHTCHVSHRYLVPFGQLLALIESRGFEINVEVCVCVCVCVCVIIAAVPQGAA